MPTPERLHLPWRGVAFGLIAAFLLSSQDLIIKLLAGDYHILQIIFMRAAIGLLLAASLMMRAHNISEIKQRPSKLVMFRVGANLIANLCYYIALSILDLAVYTCLGLTVFLFATALSGPLLKEKSSLFDWVAVFIGLIGVIIIVNPSSTTPINLPAALLLLFGAFMWALSIVITRALGSTISALGILFYSSAALTVVGLISLPFVWRAPTLSDAILMIMLGILGSSGQGLAIAAYRNARISVVIPTQHTMLLWATFFAWLVWEQIPDTRLWFSGALIIGATLVTLPKPRYRKKS